MKHLKLNYTVEVGSKLTTLFLQRAKAGSMAFSETYTDRKTIFCLLITFSFPF